MHRQSGSLLFIALFWLSGISGAQEIQWQTDVDAATDTAIAQNKLILLHFSAEWCRPCKNLEKFVFTSHRVIKSVQERVVPVHIDTDMHPELVKKFAVSEIPCDVIITTKGRVVTKRKSPRTADDYVRMLDALPASKVATKQQNIELTQKIDQVISAANDQAVQKNNDFQPNAFASRRPDVSTEGMKLAAKAETQLVSHNQNGRENVDSNESQNVASSDFTVNRSQRIINDTFFVEKSAQASKAKKEIDTGMNDLARTGEVNNFGPEKDDTVSEAKLASPEEKNAARILTPSQGKMAVGNQFIAQPLTDSGKSLKAEPVPAKKVAKSTATLIESKQHSMENESHSGVKAESESVVQTTEVNAGQSELEPEYALAGKCPVTLIKEGRWVAGDKKFGCIHRGRLYLFADKLTMSVFQKDPESYSPVLAGYDPVLFHEAGELVDGDAKHGVFMGKSPRQRIVLFKSQETRSKFQAEPQKFMNTIRLAVEQSKRVMK